MISLPHEEEQTKVVQKINEIIERTKNTICVLNEEISILREYRIRLISDAVTGQIDVRNIAVPEYEYVEENLVDELDSADESEEPVDKEVP